MLRTSYLPYCDLFLEYTESAHKHDMQVLQYHNAYELFFMVQGTRYLFMDGTCQILNAGDLYLIKPYQTHYTQSLSSAYYARYVMNFPPDYLDDFFTSAEKARFFGELHNAVIHLSETQLHQVSSILAQLQEYYPKHGYIAEKFKRSCCLQLILLYKSFLSEQEIAPAAQHSDAGTPRQEIIDIISYMNLHYQNKINLDMLAAHVHLSKYYLCRLFQEVTGATIVEYLTNLRIAQAQKLLINSEFTIQEIALRTGFTSAVHFSRTYHDIYGVSPCQARQQYRSLRTKTDWN